MNITEDQKTRIATLLVNDERNSFFPKLVNDYIFPRLEKISMSAEEFKDSGLSIDSRSIALNFAFDNQDLLFPQREAFADHDAMLANLTALDFITCEKLVEETAKAIITALALEDAEAVYAASQVSGLDNELKKLISE